MFQTYDPRNTSPGQLSSVVNEVFNGVASSTITKGRRHYKNSTLIIGTQECLLGMETNNVNMATFSRLSHIDFNVGEATSSQSFDYNHEKPLQRETGGSLLTATTHTISLRLPREALAVVRCSRRWPRPYGRISGGVSTASTRCFCN